MAEVLVVAALTGVAMVGVVVEVWALLRGPDRSRAMRPCERCDGEGRVRRFGHLQPSRCPVCSGRGRRPRQDGAWL